MNHDELAARIGESGSVRSRSFTRLIETNGDLFLFYIIFVTQEWESNGKSEMNERVK